MSDTSMVRNKRPVEGHRAAILGILFASIVVVELPMRLASLPGWRGWALPCSVLSLALMAGLPFLLAKLAPKVAGFSDRWLPSARSQWLWFAGMVLLLLGVSQLFLWLWSFREDWSFISLRLNVVTDYVPRSVVLRGVVMVLLAPIAEEIFWRGYLLAQLKKLAPWGIALVLQSLLFAFAHLPNPWLALSAFLYGTILGAWRLRFGSLLPLILAHTILNGVVLIPHLKTEYDAAVRSYPKCHEIDLLVGEPAEKAVPALIGFLADRDEVVSAYAITVLRSQYRSKAQPYLREALASSDRRTVDRVLFAIEWCGYVDLIPEVRKIAWSFDDVGIQIAATMTLGRLKDTEGLRDIARRHPNEKVRHAANALSRHD